MRRILTLLALLSIVLVVALPVGASLSTARTWDRYRVDRVRSVHGVAPIWRSWPLTKRAQRWANHLAATMSLQDDMNGQYVCWGMGGSDYGANVGDGGSLRSIQYAMEKSAPHLGNIIDRHFRRIGIGIAHSNGLTWLVQDFCG